MKIINVSKAPYEWTWDSCNYGPIKPGEVMDLPQEVAEQAIKRSAVTDDEGNIEAFRVEPLEKVKKNSEWLQAVATYPCPFSATGQCDAAPFKDINELRVHLDTHFNKGKASK